MKCAIHMEIAFWNNIIEADDPVSIYYQIGRVQDLGCLYNMGMSMEDTKKGMEGLKKLGQFFDRLHADDFSVEDFKLIDMDLSCGSFHITEVAEGEEAVEALKKKYPDVKVISC